MECFQLQKFKSRIGGKNMICSIQKGCSKIVQVSIRNVRIHQAIYDKDESEKLPTSLLTVASSMAMYFHDSTGYATFINGFPKD